MLGYSIYKSEIQCPHFGLKVSGSRERLRCIDHSRSLTDLISREKRLSHKKEGEVRYCPNYGRGQPRRNYQKFGKIRGRSYFAHLD